MPRATALITDLRHIEIGLDHGKLVAGRSLAAFLVNIVSASALEGPDPAKVNASWTHPLSATTVLQ